MHTQEPCTSDYLQATDTKTRTDYIQNTLTTDNTVNAASRYKNY